MPLNPVPAGEELESAGSMTVFGEPPQVDPIPVAGAPATTTDPTLARILTGIQSLLAAAKLPPV